MTITTLRPTGAETKRGQITYSSGTTIVPLIDDEPAVDTSYVSCANGSQWPETAFWVNLPDNTPALSANQRIKQVRIRARVRLSTADGGRAASITVDTRDDRDGTGTLGEKFTTSNASTFTEKVGVWRTKPTKPSLTELNQSDLNHYQIYCNFLYTCCAGIRSNLRVSELYLDIDVRSLGTVTGVGVTGNDTSSRPTVSWTFNPNADNDIQAWYFVKIFSSTQYTAAGFTPFQSGAIWESLWRAGNADNIVVETDLVAAVTYRAYVIAGQDFNGQRWQTAYANSVAFTMGGAVVPTPLLTVTPDPSLPWLRNKLSIRGNFNMLSAQNASFDDSTLSVGLWTATTNCTIARSTTQTAYGAGSMAMTATGTSDMTADTPRGISGIPVRAGLTYTFMAEFRANTTARTVLVNIAWYNIQGVMLNGGAYVTGATKTDSNTGWVQSTGTAVAPTGTAFASIMVQIVSPVVVGEIHYVDKVGLFPA